MSDPIREYDPEEHLGTVERLERDLATAQRERDELDKNLTANYFDRASLAQAIEERKEFRDKLCCATKLIGELVDQLQSWIDLHPNRSTSEDHNAITRARAFTEEKT